MWEDRFGKDKSDYTAVRWWKLLSKHMDTETFERAAAYIFENSTFFPKPAEVIEVARRIQRAEEHLRTVEYLEERNERIKRQMEEQGRKLLERAEGGKEEGVKALKEYLRTHAAVPIDERDRIEGDSDEEKRLGRGEQADQSRGPGKSGGG